MSEEKEKIVQVLFKCPESLKAQAVEAAWKRRLDLSKFIRQAIQREIDQPAPAAAEQQ